MNTHPTPPACENARELLARRVDEALSVPDEDLLRRHLAGCDSCREVESWIGDVDGLSARASVPDASEEDLARVEAAVMREIRPETRSAPAPRPVRRRPIPRWFVPSAAAAAVVALFSWWQLEEGEDPLRMPDTLEEPSRRVQAADELGRGRLGEEKRSEDFVDEVSKDAEPELAARPAELANAAKSAAPEEPQDQAVREQELTDYAVDTVEEAVARQSGVVERDGELYVRGGRSGELSLQDVSGEVTDALLEKEEPSAAAPASLAQLPEESDADRYLDLRDAFRLATAEPNQENVARLLDAWAAGALDQQTEELRVRTLASTEARKAQPRSDQFVQPKPSFESVSFADSLRAFLLNASGDPELSELNQRILRALREFPDPRE